MTLSLMAGESPARFPIPQIAWSAIPGLFSSKNWTIKGMILQLTMAYTYSGPPVDILEMIHVA